MINRADLESRVHAAIKRSRVTLLFGPRQCGKTTLARDIAAGVKSTYFDLESSESQARLREPMTALESLRGLVVIDEVQRQPELFPLLRVLADRKPLPARFLILGSAAPPLLRQTSETLAGRVEFVEMSGFNLQETPPLSWKKLWWRGRFPSAYLARSDENARAWQESFIQSFLRARHSSTG